MLSPNLLLTNSFLHNARPTARLLHILLLSIYLTVTGAFLEFLIHEIIASRIIKCMNLIRKTKKQEKNEMYFDCKTCDCLS